MDETKVLELKVGIFIMIGIMILFIIIFSIGDIYLVKKGYHLKVRFNFASGIGPSAPIRLAGVGIGQVQGIKVLYDDKEKRPQAEIYAYLQDNARIEEDAVVTINTLGLLGEKYLEIMPGTPGKRYLKDNETITGKDPVIMEKLTENLVRLSDSAIGIMDQVKSGKGTIGKLLYDDAVYDNLEGFTADIKKHPWKLLSKPRGED
jgi:phospholipid/cholesterol/gamma-HCH transport system substrate-binding protein